MENGIWLTPCLSSTRHCLTEVNPLNNKMAVIEGQLVYFFFEVLYNDYDVVRLPESQAPDSFRLKLCLDYYVRLKNSCFKL